VRDPTARGRRTQALTLRPVLARLITGGDRLPEGGVVFVMPEHTQRAHSDPSWTGDSLAALDTVAKMAVGPDGIRAADRNFQWAWNDPKDHSKGGIVFCLHWAHPPLNNYHYLLEPGAKKARPMTHAETARSVSRWPSALVRRWRRTADPKSAQPPTYGAMVKKAVSVGVVITAELKSDEFAIPEVAAQVVATAKFYKHPPYFMALWYSMPNCKGKCEAIVNAGGQFAVIFGTHQEYRTRFAEAVKTWPVQPTRIW
jgi:hypothetical protein